MNAESAIWALVPAAGAGKRMEANLPKQYLPLLGQAVIAHTLGRLCAHRRVRGVLVGLSPGDRYWANLVGTCPPLSKLIGTFQGGKVRAQTVLNGLHKLSEHAQPADWVLVHDAVRPCLRQADVDKLVAATTDYPDGALLAVPVTDTVKRADPERRVLQTVPRAGLWHALTPQLFRLKTLRRALENAVAEGVEITDEAVAIERSGGHPRVVPGHADNLKITVAADLQLAELYLRQQQNEAA